MLSLIQSPTKKCPKCQQSKNLEEFHQDRSQKDGRFFKCKDCTHIYNISDGRKYIRRENDRKRRAAKLNCNDIFSIEDEKQLKLKFHNCCFRCGMTEKEHQQKFGTDLHVDHHYSLIDYKIPLRDSNAVLLCFDCNTEKKKQHPTKFYTLCQRIDLYITYGIIDLRDRDYQI